MKPRPASRQVVSTSRGIEARMLSVFFLFAAAIGSLKGQTIFTWPSGAVPTVNIAAGDTLNITTTSTHNFDGQAIVNNGTINWDAGNVLAGNGGTLVNNSILNDGSTGTFGNSG